MDVCKADKSVIQNLLEMPFSRRKGFTQGQ
jgi:hypothetical protein